MLTICRLITETLARRRRAGGVLSVFSALLLSACGSTASPSSSSGTPAASPTPAVPTSTPGPSSIQATLSGDPTVAGPLVKGASHFVTCQQPSLKGETILAFENATDPAVGVLLTIHATSIEVRLAKSSAGTFSARVFDGTGVTSFSAAEGAKFTSSLTETTPATVSKGTLKPISSISGSVSCGTFTPGSASVTVAGDTAVGTISGGLSAARVICGSNTAGRFATVTGLSKLGSMPVVVSLVGGTVGAPFYVILQTATKTYQFSSPAAGAVTVTGGGATYHATVMDSTQSAGVAPQSLAVSGTASCGS